MKSRMYAAVCAAVMAVVALSLGVHAQGKAAARRRLRPPN